MLTNLKGRLCVEARTPRAWLGFLLLLLAGLVFATPRAEAVPSLMGQTVTLVVNFQTSADTFVNANLLVTNFTVGSGQEVSGVPVSVTFNSGGFPQTLTGTVSADVGASSISVNFTGTQEPGGLYFILTNINHGTIGSITNAAQTSASGFQNGINQPLSPSFDNTGGGSVTCGFFPFGFQPGVSMNQGVSIGFAAPAGGGPAPTSQLIVSAPGNATAGNAFNYTVTAEDASGNTTTGYSGTVHFTSTDGAASLPADVTLLNGVGTFSATLKTAGNQTLTATDTATSSITGTSGNVTVTPAAASHFSVSAPPFTTAGNSFNITVTALDPFNNTATGYSGTVHFFSTDGQAVLPANSTLANGFGTFSATLKTAGNQTTTVTDTVIGSITGTSGNITVNPATATHFAVGGPPLTTTAGFFLSVTVTALDQFNNTATGYVGSIHVTSTDVAAILPIFFPLSGGVGDFPVTFRTAGNQTLTATDSSITGTSGFITVNPGPAVLFIVNAPGTVRARVAFNFTVTAMDAFQNIATFYPGTVHFTSTDGAAILPADSALFIGTGIFSATLQTQGTQIITGTDIVNPFVTGTSGPMNVLDLQITAQPADTNVLVGTNVTFSVTATGTAPFAYQWFTNGVAANGATNATLTVSNITLASPTNYYVVINNDWGSTNSRTASLVASGVFNYPTTQNSTAVLNPVTGLYEEIITVTNAAGPISGVRLLVSGLPQGVSLYNATGTNAGVPYAQFDVAMPPGGVTSFLLQFLNPMRGAFANAVQVVALNPGAAPVPGIVNNTRGVPITQVAVDNTIPGSPRFTFGFSSIPGAAYQVLYSDDGMATWHVANTFTASANWTIWTEALSPAPGVRLFKAILLLP